MEAARQTIEAHPEAYARLSFVFAATPMHERLVQGVRLKLFLLFGAVALVLLVACFNVGNLLLARATARQRELAIRSALGAGRSALVRQLLAESVLLALAAGVLGTVLAYGSTSALLASAPAGLPRVDTVHLDGTVLAFAVAAALLSALLFGLVPALAASDLELERTLRDSGSMRPRGQVLRRVLVMLDVGLALVLLCAASLLLRSFVHALGVEPGFQPRGLTIVQVVVPVPSGTTRDQANARFRAYGQRAMQTLRTLPGVEAAGAINMLPLGNPGTVRLFSVKDEPEAPGAERRAEQYRVVMPGFFEALHIPLLTGRSITDADSASAPRVAVVNAAFARKVFPQAEAMGQRIGLDFPVTTWATIVGVVGDVREFGLDAPTVPVMYFPYDQEPGEGLAYVVRSPAPFQEVGRAVTDALLAVDSSVPVFGTSPYESLLSASVAQRRFSLLLVGTFACLALLLAALGLYGVVAYSVRQRTKEIGVRMAVGADARRIAQLVAAESARMVGVGAVLGLAASLVVSRLLTGFLYGVGPADPVALGAAALVLATAAVLATVLPVRRAVRVDPVVALAAE